MILASGVQVTAICSGNHGDTVRGETTVLIPFKPSKLIVFGDQAESSSIRQIWISGVAMLGEPIHPASRYNNTLSDMTFPSVEKGQTIVVEVNLGGDGKVFCNFIGRRT